MSDIAIKIENISKMYRLGTVGSGTITGDFNRLMARLLGKEDPYTKIGQVNDRKIKSKGDFVWSLKDINFDIKQGSAIGIVGKNGAGKSTLLKILSRVTGPTSGSVKIKGRIASLLEVGTGFHPELSGRDNIFMNGSILGMTRMEIKNKFDEIVDFSGVEKYIDTPVKRYSSGMYVRLAFAVAAHLEPEILIVDEVLAVGDAEFQKKCLGKMQDVNSKEGRTVLFVSHNIASIKSLCTKGILLANGTLALHDHIDNVVHQYQSHFLEDNVGKTINEFADDFNLLAQFKRVELISDKSTNCTEFDVFDPLYLRIDMIVRTKIEYSTPILIVKKDGADLFWSFASDCDEALLNGMQPGNYSFKVKLPGPLKNGMYSCEFRIGKLRVGDIDKKENAIVFSINDYSFDPTNKSYSGLRPGIIPAILKWENI